MSNPSSEQARDVILDSIADGVFTVDNDWHVTSFNRAAERITGVSRARAVGQRCFDVFRASICPAACALREAIKSGRQRINRKTDILNSRGEKIPVSVSTAVLRDANGEVIGGVDTFRDLSAVVALRKEIDDHYTFHDILGKNRQIRQILAILPDIAASNSTVLIEGPSGSGKELFAKAIHDLGGRAGRKYVAVSCAALPDTLLEAELFGYKKGAFSDAKRDKPGRFALAAGGTLFLNEIGSISTALQVKLLRTLREKEYQPLGGSTTRASARVIAASDKPLAEFVARGAFRDDLYCRLNVLKIVLPPLARRREDIPLLVDHFIRKFGIQQGKQVEDISEEALSLLMGHAFPGNVRQLQNVIEHAVVLCRGSRIEIDSLPAALGIDKTTLWRKMKKFGITCP